MIDAALPPYASWEVVAERLPSIFPEGISNRGYCIRDLAVSTVFVMLYIGAVVGTNRFLAPKHVYRMTDHQAARTADSARVKYASDAMRPGFASRGRRWYADNTREPIRDETLREGLVANGAVSAREDLPTTSSLPRYALETSFAALFDSSVQAEHLADAISTWQKQNLSKGALARIALVRRGATAKAGQIPVTFPNGDRYRLTFGLSSQIAKAVIENFAQQFLERPVVLWVSESGNRVVARYDELAASIGLKIRADKNAPDIVLADLGPSEPLVIFVEVVATDGAMTQRRREALWAYTKAAGFAPTQVAFVTAYWIAHRPRSARPSPNWRGTRSRGSPRSRHRSSS